MQRGFHLHTNYSEHLLQGTHKATLLLLLCEAAHKEQRVSPLTENRRSSVGYKPTGGHSNITHTLYIYDMIKKVK